MSLIVALYAIKLTAQDVADSRYSYGWHRAEILAALINGVFLLALCFSIFMEAIERFFSTPEISSPRLVVIVGCFGLASNIVGLFLFHEHDHSHDGPSEDKTTGSESDHERIEGETESGTTTPTALDTKRGRRRSVDSLFGHPVATRNYVVQTAHDMQLARSPSPRREEQTQEGIHSVLDSATLPESDYSESSIATGHTESTPLLRDARSQSSGTSPQSQGTIDMTQSPKASQDKKPRKHGGHGHSHAHGSMNMRALVLHVMGDALGNVGVIATGLVIWLTTYSWRFYFDPVISLVITVIIFSSALPLVKSASFILLQGVPSGISLEEVDASIRDVDGVHSVHELHIWQLSETKIVASVHVLASKKNDFMQVAADIRKALHDHGIHSSTIQPEYYHNSRHQSTMALPSGASCLIPCPPGRECDPSQNACCPPPQTQA
ncbi:cation efflux protein [Rickenella mellea]|uniref:Cation efflux protein n=1 Tax=Rickenella mellea TaxID=50990 RepID=A0A4Y7QM22_9AGAM|nr:cation efflux protein [Rickenella mellea]